MVLFVCVCYVMCYGPWHNDAAVTCIVRCCARDAIESPRRRERIWIDIRGTHYEVACMPAELQVLRLRSAQ